MAEKIEVVTDLSLTPVIISDRNGTSVGVAFLNANDIRIPARVTEIIDYMKSIDVDRCDYETLHHYNEMLEDKFCGLFGYDCRQSLFCILSPTTICNGKFAAILILEKVMEALSDDIKAKAAKRAEIIGKYVPQTK